MSYPDVPLPLALLQCRETFHYLIKTIHYLMKTFHYLIKTIHYLINVVQVDEQTVTTQRMEEEKLDQEGPVHVDPD